jgi:methylmalonyl-CoA mutase cobalamin-binding subunit
VIPEKDEAALLRSGVARVFTMGAETSAIVAYLREWQSSR